ncbi:MAG TPA: 4Fe-4S binding protein [Acidimicrobiales bacterium]|nr:4Fe-4S binding protein [Acidimicrobiales bacterium]
MTLAITIDGRCTGCGMCIATCPERALWVGVKRPLADAGACTACLACVEVCPVDAIAVTQAVAR